LSGSKGAPEASLPVRPAEAPSPGPDVNALDFIFGAEARAAAGADDVISERSVLDGAPLHNAPPPGAVLYVPPSAPPATALLEPSAEVAIHSTPLEDSAAVAEARHVQLRINAHIACRGDVKAAPDGWAGERGSGLRLEGFTVTVIDGIDPDDLEYRALLDDGALTGWHRDESFCGTRGEHRQLQGVALRVVGHAATTHRVSYSAVFIDGTEVGPMADGMLCATANACALEAIKIEVYPQENRQDRPRLEHPYPHALSEPGDQTRRETAMQFESLGGGSRHLGWAFGCEFGFFQRDCGIEPPGLLRWASVSAPDLLKALRNGFQGVEDQQGIELREHSDYDWGLTQTTYRLFIDHTGLTRSEVSAESARIRTARTLGALRNRLIDDLKAGQKLFVYRTYDHHVSDDVITDLANAVGAYGPSTLCYIRTDGRPFTATRISSNLIVGYIDRFAPQDGEIVYNHSGWFWTCSAILNEAKRTIAPK